MKHFRMKYWVITLLVVAAVTIGVVRLKADQCDDFMDCMVWKGLLMSFCPPCAVLWTCDPAACGVCALNPQFCTAPVSPVAGLGVPAS